MPSFIYVKDVLVSFPLWDVGSEQLSNKEVCSESSTDTTKKSVMRATCAVLKQVLLGERLVKIPVHLCSSARDFFQNGKSVILYISRDNHEPGFEMISALRNKDCAFVMTDDRIEGREIWPPHDSPVKIVSPDMTAKDHDDDCFGLRSS